jgi:threonyl-tRNA synthetase
MREPIGEGYRALTILLCHYAGQLPAFAVPSDSVFRTVLRLQGAKHGEDVLHVIFTPS